MREITIAMVRPVATASPATLVNIPVSAVPGSSSDSAGSGSDTVKVALATPPSLKRTARLCSPSASEST